MATFDNVFTCTSVSAFHSISFIFAVAILSCLYNLFYRLYAWC